MPFASSSNVMKYLALGLMSTTAWSQRGMVNLKGRVTGLSRRYDTQRRHM
jgi:hypothetical protein